MKNICWRKALVALSMFVSMNGLLAQPTSCGLIVNTGVNHTIILANFLPTFDSLPLPNGSYIIVQYELAGNLVCGGFAKWNGVNTSISAYGDDPNTPAKDGFVTGEVFKYKLELPDGRVFDTSRIQVAYATGGIFSNTNAFQVNGISGLNQFEATSSPCPSQISNFSDTQSLCDGSTPILPTDSIILSSVDYPDSARIIWSADPLQPLIYGGDGCQPDTFNLHLTVQCLRDSNVQLNGGDLKFLVYPRPQAPAVELDTFEQNLCSYQVIPHCLNDLVQPGILNGIPNGTIGLVQTFSVANTGCAAVVFDSITVPDCLFDAVDELTGVDQLKVLVQGNPFSDDESPVLQIFLPKRSSLVISIIDVNGKLHGRGIRSLPQGTQFLSLKEVTSLRFLPTGLFFLELRTENSLVVKKVIKQ